jgi:hypothetical protein
MNQKLSYCRRAFYLLIIASQRLYSSSANDIYNDHDNSYNKQEMY